ncbi:hypothetical protein BFW38_13255 [Terasakiispira papahanaumokuakeensis]|uniref:histidine kinase n=1 Tax=Terasakiispira papahanaumokuakeensis TaxID=197479 RepID=A0A1E2VBI8_9GAMM|nr:sensor histidine kinase [Terasakiispira papahanaumokuakeensis]ODC04357.1 hypothetical protein BFW38_13255 [Terasakiispira papahanaumokuakeensis]
MTRFRQGQSLEAALRRHLLWVMLMVMGGLLTMVHFGVEKLSHDFVLARLEDDAQSLIAALSQTPDGGWQLNFSRLPDVYSRVRSGHYYQIRYRTIGGEWHELRSRSLWDQQIEQNTLSAGQHRTHQAQGPAKQDWLIWEQGFRRLNSEFSLWMAEDIAAMRDDQRQFELSLLALVTASIFLMLGLQRRVLMRGFARLAPIRRALEDQRSGQDVHMPDDLPDEVQPLVQAIEQALQRSGEQTKRSRLALGNLAHELKRPLQQLQWLADQAPESSRTELQQLYQRLRHLIDRELRRARIAGSPSPGQYFDPHQEIPILVTVLERMDNDQIQFTSSLPDQSLPYDRDDMLELLGNLLDNAWRHAHRRVHLTIETLPQQWQLLIEDDGPGVPEAQRRQLTHRGVRLDESGSGHGLGLSICTAVVESYQGEMVFEPSPLGGLRVAIRLQR